MELEQQIRDILTREMPGVVVEIERDNDTEKVGGRVIWEGFARQDALRRQNRIFKLLHQHLTNTEVQKEISFIFTYTPAEYEQALVA